MLTRIAQQFLDYVELALSRKGRRGPVITGIWGLLLLGPLAMAQQGSTAPEQSQPTPNSPPNVIFDTDIWSDIDDALALAMLHALHDRNEINLVAVTINTNEAWCASYVKLLNSFYGHPQIPVGLGGLDTAAVRKNTWSMFKGVPNFPWPATRYTQRITEQSERDGTFSLPRSAVNQKTTRDAVTVLRETLARQPDGSVVMIGVGYNTNLAQLLASKPDNLSPLNGRDLIAKKVRMLSMMAGNFGDIRYEGKTYPKGRPEFNLLADVPAAKKVFASWPTPIVASGFEIGLQLLYPGTSIDHDYAYVPEHPIAETYRMFCDELKAFQKWSCPHQHPTFDLTSVLYAARPGRDYFTVSKPGKITVLDDGGSRFDYVEGGRDRFLILNDEKNRALEAMVMLASQPPTQITDPALVSAKTSRK
jgi:inosine-uridine nucleoside N-ribohydrolase